MTPRERHLKSKYGISVAQYDGILQKQKGCCPICKRASSVFKTRLAVDHNHKTGSIRGLLCYYCNKYLVGRHTDPELVLRIYEYLQQSTGLFVPPTKKKKRRRTKKRKK